MDKKVKRKKKEEDFHWMPGGITTSVLSHLLTLSQEPYQKSAQPFYV